MGRVRTKICGIGTAEDLVAAVDAGADAVGLIVGTTHHSDDEIPVDQARVLAASVPAFITIVLVTHLVDGTAILDLAEAIGVDTVQVHGEVDPQTLRDIWVRRRSLRIIRTIHVTGESAIAAAHEAHRCCHAVLLDTRTPSRLGGTGLTHDWAISRRIAEALRKEGRGVILAGGLDATNVASAISAVQPHGVDANSRLKNTNGRKDPASCRAFVCAATNAATSAR
ncbi:phosphoribosylanthranilate isomerase [Mycobacterium spongiae]|uniref:N-(5'-phosphoribosyl)anthranilate isomerase n=1 Tax=Mycobacterium spongiae TaxID=886343 RepID=A0A975PXF7_9MYCO|nr:phosphoribosylanthranilate isomerase [Mycobacterium spongiae]QUR67769.1 phosphoribosylanthranilate isomerase [Mycobacterium spongiae]